MGEALPKKDEEFPGLGAAPAGKKEKKKKAAKVNLNDFLSEEAGGGGGSWADEEVASDGKFAGGDFSGGYGAPPAAAPSGPGGYSLPTGPGQAGPQEVPQQGPWKVYVGNLPYETRDEDLAGLFEDGGCVVSDVHLVMDRELQRPKGFGYVEFGDRESCVKALEADGHDVMGRKLKVDVATQSQNSRQSGSKYGGNPDWGSARSFKDDSYGSGGGFGDRGGKGGDRGGDRYGDRGGKGGDRGGFEDRGSRYGGGGLESGRAGMGAPVERPKLALQKRTVADPPSAPVTKSGGSNPFGEAAPRDEDAAQRKIAEDRKAREAAGEAPSREAPRAREQKPRNDPFGGAKATDTSKWDNARAPRENEDRAPRRDGRGPREPREQNRSKVGVWGNSAK